MKAALDYGRLGWSVIPIESRGKRPLIPWEPFQHRRTEALEVADWFRRWPDANIAVVTGVVSGVLVLDLDPRHGADASLARWEQEQCPLAGTVEARTGGGGRHLYFAHPGEVIRNRVGLAQGIDLRGDGGYAVAPPSVHASGEAYRWERSPETFLLAPLPEWLRRQISKDPSHCGHPPAHWRGLLREGVAEGGRNDAIASLAGHLLWHGLDPQVAADLLLSWNRVRCRPPLGDEEVMRTFESILRLHRRGENGNE